MSLKLYLIRQPRGILEEEDSILIHGYMNNSGYEDVRCEIAESIKHGTYSRTVLYHLFHLIRYHFHLSLPFLQYQTHFIEISFNLC